MRRPRLSSATVPISLVGVLLLLLSLLPAGSPAAMAQEGPSLRLTTRGDHAGLAETIGTRGAVLGTRAGDPPQATLGAGGADALAAAPVVSLPTGGDGATPAVAEIQVVNPENHAKLGGLSPETAAGIRFEPPEPALAAVSDACEQLVRNSSIFAHQEGSGYTVYDWTVIQPNIYVQSDTFFSYPYALSMLDADEPTDDGRPGRNRDEDWFGQAFYFPAGVRSMQIEFNIYYPGGNNLGFDSADFGYVELYRLDAEGRLIDEQPGDDFLQGMIIRRIDSLTPGDIVLDTWYRFTFFFDATRFADFDALAGQRVALVFDQDGDRLAPFEYPHIDNPQLTVCPTAAQPTKAVEGFVEVRGLPLAGQNNASISTATLGLLYYASTTGAPELVRVGYPTANGYFRFLGLPDLPPGGAYQVLYLNSGFESEPEVDGGPRLAFYASRLVTEFSRASGGYSYGDAGVFDIADVALGRPVNYGEVSGDVQFSWTPRQANGDQGSFVCFYDPETFIEVCTEKPIAGSSATFNAAALQAVQGFPFALGKPIGWYVQVAGRDYNESSRAFDGVGASRFSHFVTFVEDAPVPPPAPAPENKQAPPADPDPERWTLMFYLAGDDEELTSPEGNARGMVDILSNLNQLTDQFPNLNIVVQFDFFERRVGDPPRSNLPAEIRGTQRCYLQSDRPNLVDACRQLGELNTGDPQHLTDFIVDAMTQRPAERYGLVIMGHGNGVTGVAGDRTGDAEGVDDALRPWELEKALRDANAVTKRKLDLLLFYACLMGNFETAALVAPYAGYMVASPNIATLVDISAELLSLASRSSDPRAVAAGAVAAYNSALRSYNGFYGRNLSIAMAAFDLSRVEALKPLVSALGTAIRENLNLNDVGNARAGVQLYDSSAPELWGFTAEGEDALVDLRHLATLLATSGNSGVRTAATNLLAGLGGVGAADGLVVASVAASGQADLRAGGSHTLGNAGGLSIFFPTGSAAGNQGALTRNYLLYFRQTTFRSGSWDELVDATRTGIPSLPRGGRLTALAGAPGSTLQNLGAPEVFPTLSTLPRPAVDGGDRPFKVRLPLTRR